MSPSNANTAQRAQTKGWTAIALALTAMTATAIS